jgi:hypothetical protein
VVWLFSFWREGEISQRKYVLLAMIIASFLLSFITFNGSYVLAEKFDGLLKMLNKIGFAPIAYTGQTISYATGDDGDLQMGISPVGPRFTDNLDGTITDNLTGLNWLKNANSFEIMDFYSGCETCNNLEDDGLFLTDGSQQGEWRLPNIRELQSLINYARFNPALSDDHPFIDVQSYQPYAYYWTSTAHGLEAEIRAWSVDFRHGFIAHRGKTALIHVWCVRNK